MRVLMILSLAALTACGAPRAQGVGFGEVGAAGSPDGSEMTTEELATIAQAQAAE